MGKCFPILFVTMLISQSLLAQSPSICGAELLKSYVTTNYPEFSPTLNRSLRLHESRASYYSQTPMLKVSPPAAIPVIFHILLTQSQIDEIGGVAGVLMRLDSQLITINRDFNAMNPDSLNVPAPFRQYYANVGIQFAMAHTDPAGAPTPGYEIRIADFNGVQLKSTCGSGYAFSKAKYSNSGGCSSWDPASYLNIWIINPLNENTASDIVGFTVPFSYTGEGSGIPVNEAGVVLHYKAFGQQTSPSQAFVYGRNVGRTLTHELGHFFEIWHTWGDDNGACPGNGGIDDGIQDTPPQASADYGCPNFPKYDACSPAVNGVMFMNYMDYSDDNCKCMFTKDQASVMIQQTSFSGESYSLTHHPQLLLWPANEPDSANIFPNPTTDIVNLLFDRVPSDLQELSVINMLGQVLLEVDARVDHTAFYSFDLSSFQPGIYFIECTYLNKKYVQKIFRK